jgi:dihydroxyacetone kinase-like predicted kinase
MSEVVYRSPEISREDYEKFKGRHVALHDGRIVACGDTPVEALEKALEKYPDLKPEQIELYYIQIVDELIL